MEILFVSSKDVIDQMKDIPENIFVIDDYSTLNVMLKFPTVAVDIETYVPLQLKGRVQKALDPHTSAISIITCYPVGSNMVIIFDYLAFKKNKKALNLMKEILASRECILCHNASFEAKFLKKHLGLTTFNWWCTRVASQLVANATGGGFINQIGGNSLGSIVLNYLGVSLTGKKQEQIEDWMARPISNAKLEYAINDVIYLPDLKELFESVLIPPQPTFRFCNNPQRKWGLGMKDVMELEMAYVAVEAEMEYNGIPFNKFINDKFQGMIFNEKENTGIVYDIGVKLAKLFGYKTYINNLTGKESIGPDVFKALRSSSQLLNKLNNDKVKLPNTESRLIRRLLELYDLIEKGEKDPFYCDEEYEAYQAIKDLDESEIHGQQEILDLVSKFKKYTKQASMNLSKKQNVVTKRLHPGFNSLGAKTGRSSSSGPWF